MVTKTLDGMAAGGMYDLVGGGFHRYSVDERWLVPHFEKMLYDNALLASAYLHAWVVTGEPRTARSSRRRSTTWSASCGSPSGGLASAQDADTERRRGADVHLDGGRGRAGASCCSRSSTAARSSAARSTPSSAPGCSPSVRSGPSRASTTRCSPPGTGSPSPRSPRPRAGSSAPDWLAAARGVGEFLLGPLSREDGRLSRSWREGRVSGEGFLDDYANAAHGLLELHLATGEPRWLTEAHRLALLAVELFHDPEHGGFFLAPTGGEELVARTKGLDDNPIPSGNSMLAHVLLRLGRIWGDDELERLGVSVFRLVAPTLARAPARSAGRCARSTSGSAPPRELAIVGPVDSAVARAALAPVRAEHRRRVRARRRRAAARGKGLSSTGKPAVYVCERFACQAPVTDPRTLSGRSNLRRMTTIEQTGAEEVAWDLSDLYASGDDPRIESDVAEAEAAAAAFRERYLRQGRDPLGGASSRRRSTSTSGSSRSRRAPSTTRT